MTHTPERMEDRTEKLIKEILGDDIDKEKGKWKIAPTGCGYNSSFEEEMNMIKSFIRTEIEKTVLSVIGEDEKMVEDKYCKHCNELEYDCRYYITDERNALRSEQRAKLQRILKKV